ncbi:hypothetical protein GCM10010518_27140 [Kitasatospora cinereorecta]
MEFRTACRSPVAPGSPGSDLPLHTTGARLRPPAPLMAGILTGPAEATDRRRVRWPGASCTRKLAWLTMTCAGSLSTFVMLRAGWSSNRGVLVSTLI